MKTFTATALVHATPERIWSVMADVVHWPRWLPTVTQVNPLDAADLAVGARYRISQPTLRPAVWTVTSLTPLQEFAWVKASRGLKVTGSHRIDVLAQGECRLTLEIVFDGMLAPVAGWFAGGLTRRYLATEAEAIRSRVESSPTRGEKT